MFYVWDVAGIKRPYAPGAIKASRRVEPTRPSESVAALHQSPETSGGDAFTQAMLKRYSDSEVALQKREKALTAEQIMSSPVYTLSKSDSLQKAWESMCTYRFRHIPITDAEGHLCGILSDRDVLRATPLFHSAQNIPAREQVISEHMADVVLTAEKQAPIREVARVLVEERIGSMPIVENGQQLCGILTRTDILRAVVWHAPLQLWI